VIRLENIGQRSGARTPTCRCCRHLWRSGPSFLAVTCRGHGQAAHRKPSSRVAYAVADWQPSAATLRARMLAAGMRAARASERGIYDLTAPMIVFGAERILEPGFTRSGALAPAQAVEPRALLRHLAQHGLSYEIHDAESNQRTAHDSYSHLPPSC
jgi:hypothetical protein